MKLVNWNVGCANPGSKGSRTVGRALDIRNRIVRCSPDIVCLTETHSELLLGANRIWGRPGCGSRAQEGHRKVMLWSRHPWKRVVDDIGDDRLPPGRFIHGVTRTSLGDVTVVGLCIPWQGSRTPEYGGEREEWDDHEDYLKHLKVVLSCAPSERFVVMGDFNQCIVRRRRGSEAARRAELLREAIPPGVSLATCKFKPNGRKIIDHIALSADIEVQAGSLDVISNIVDPQELSTRIRLGIVADVVVQGP